MRVRAATVIAVIGSSTLAGGASATESTIVPGLGIGKVRLGMTLAQEKSVLGPTPVVNRRIQLARRRGYIEFGWNFSTLWVGFINTKGSLHAVLIGTDLARYKTKPGVGVGTRVARLIKRQPGVRCYLGADWENHPYFDPVEQLRPHCVLGGAEGRGTVFALQCLNPGPDGCLGYRVFEVIVRASF